MVTALTHGVLDLQAILLFVLDELWLLWLQWMLTGGEMQLSSCKHLCLAI